MTVNPTVPSSDDGDENPDLKVGDPAVAEHGLDVTAFVDDQTEPDIDAYGIQ